MLSISIGSMFLLGCSGGQLHPQFGIGTEVVDEAPESFELAWRTLERLTEFRLVRQQRERHRSDNPFIEDPVAAQDNRISAPKDLIYKVAIELPQAREKSIEHLNNWIRNTADDDTLDNNWRRDSLIERLPDYIQESGPIRKLNELEFVASDFDYLQQNRWLRDVSRWSQDIDDDPLTAAKVAEIESQLEEGDAPRLVEALRLFDWTVRNIRLDPLLPEPKDVAAGPTPDGGAGRYLPPPFHGNPGPGYVYYPWQVLLYGHGDSIQRARIFILLARQVGIDAVMLGFEDTGPVRRHKPWLPAVHIAGKLYLFETGLGLPIPGPGGKGIATLDDLLDDPQLLRALDIDDGDDQYQYGVEAEDLQTLVAMIEAEPAALSRRMQRVEKRLAGNRKMMLTVRPTAIAARIEQCRGIRSARIWALPFETDAFRKIIESIAQRDAVVEQMLSKEEFAFGSMNQLVTGRHLHLHGQFVKRDDEPNAAKWYLDARLQDVTIERLAESESIQQRFGMTELSDDPQMRAAQLRFFTEHLRFLKQYANFWMGLAQYELPDPGDSINWLNKVEEGAASPDDASFGGPELGPWKQIEQACRINRNDARYNLGRAYEARGQIDQARRLYLIDDSPQQHGNRLRAQQLRRLETSAEK